MPKNFYIYPDHKNGTSNVDQKVYDKLCCDHWWWQFSLWINVESWCSACLVCCGMEKKLE